MVNADKNKTFSHPGTQWWLSTFTLTFFPFVQKAQACLYQRRGCTLQVKGGDDDLWGKQEKFHPELRVKLNKLLKKKVDFVVAFVPTEDGPGLDTGSKWAAYHFKFLQKPAAKSQLVLRREQKIKQNATNK